MRKLFFIIVLFFSTSVIANKIDNYACEILLNENTSKSPLKNQAPVIIQISYDPDKNLLIDFSWDGNSFADAFEAVEFSSPSKILELWRKGFTYSQKDNVLFELYASDLVAHMYQLYVPGLDYQCKKLK